MARIVESLFRGASGDCLGIIPCSRGKAVAALVPIEDLEMIEAMEDNIDLVMARKALKEKGKPVPLETLKKQR